MRLRCCVWLLLAWGLTAPAESTAPEEVLAEAPSELSVTVYRAPYRATGSIDLDRLQGFALISETRTVRLPAGESRLRFEGVADGIEPASAIVTGLEGAVLEKNRDTALLSPSALVAAAVGKAVMLTRTRKGGAVERRPGTVLAAADGGVVFQSAQGIEGLRCSGLAETLTFENATHLAPHPTLSVLVRSRAPTVRRVTLSYLARGFDWAADYRATVSADGKTMDLGAWVTLANGNGVGFPAAHTQVVAGRLNRESGELEPLDAGGPILARCWPRGSTSDVPELLQIDRIPMMKAAKAKPLVYGGMAPAALASVAVDAQKVTQEQLGDLKLYRVPDRTTVASRQSKQVRLLDRAGIPINTVYGADLAGDGATEASPAVRYLRTSNTAANHLGLPLPSGSVAVFSSRGDVELLERESDMRDLAIDEDVEIDMGPSPQVTVLAVKERASPDPDRQRSAAVPPPVPSVPPLVPGVAALRSAALDEIERVEISNALAAPIEFELRLRLPEGARVVRADHALRLKNGRPIFRLTIPAHAAATLRFQTQRMLESAR